MVFESKFKIEIPATDLLSYLFDKSSPYSERPVLVNSQNADHKLNKAELEINVKKLGWGLKNVAGIRNDDVVLVSMANSIWFPAIIFGVICAGGIFTGANPAYLPEELTHQLRVSTARVILTDLARVKTVLAATQSLNIPRRNIFILDGEYEGCRSMKDLVSGDVLEWDRYNLEQARQKVAALNFSSGTTGPPKACMITHHNLVMNCEQGLHLDDLAKQRTKGLVDKTKDVYCAYVPLYHAMGMMMFCVTNVRRGCTTVIMPAFSLEAMLAAIEKFKVTELLTPPPVAVMIIKSPLVSKYDVSSIKYLLCGAAPLAKETSLQLEGVFEKSKATVRQGYGMTEATCSITLFEPGQVDETRAGVGYLCANMQARIVDDDMNDVGYGQVGEALVRGPNVFKGYWHNEGATKDAFTEDGWLKTGDYVEVRPDGLFTIVDRKKELIKVKGFQVAPSELEAHLLECEHVKDCAVIRVTRDGQECPQAHVVPANKDATSEAILDFMNKRLATYKRLTGGIIFTDTIPKSPSGKILRRLLRDPYAHGASKL